MKLLKNFLIAPSLVLLISSNLLAKNYTLEAMPLKEVIKLITSDLNLPYVVDSKFVEGKRSKSIQNIEGGIKALNKILKDFDLKAEIKNDLIVIKKMKIKNSSSSALEDVEVIESADLGTSKDGYLVHKSSDVGLWRGKSLQDTPYSLNVMSEDYIENLNATSIDQLWSINPVMQMNWSEQQNNNGYVFLRGFSSASSAFDGMRREKWQWTYNTNVEEYERLETISGSSGFLYGPSPVGGMRNFISKRPSATAKYSVKLGNAGGKGPYFHADLSSPLDEEGKFAYRLNVVVQDGETHVENQNLKKNIFNLALDYKVSDNVLLQGLISDSYYKREGHQATWNIATGATRPDASSIDSNKLWGQEWKNHENTVRRYSTNLLWDISDSVKLRAAFMQEKTTTSGYSGTNTIEVDGTYSQKVTNSTITDELYGTGAYAYLDFGFDTGSVNHQTTIGLQGSESHWSWDNDDQTNSKVTLTGLSLSSPTNVNAPVVAPVTTRDTKQYHMKSKNLTFGDSITFNPKWSMLVGASYLNLQYKSKNYEESTLTPSISLVYKPFEDLSLYTSYMESVELGGIAGKLHNSVAVVNAGDAMDPLKSNQIELGAKYSHNNMFYTLALFQIDKGLEYYDSTNANAPVFVQDGRQVHQGLEFTFTGKVNDDLIAVGGFTLLNAKIKENKENPELEGKRPTDVANQFAKVYLEYTPFTKKNISLNTGINYTGSFYGDKINTDKISSYTLVNIGAKYTTKGTKKPLTFRVNINNVADKEYWVNKGYLGDRRTVHASVTMKF
ncbi:MAG: TonB-dependent siderophore receptor [Arcobacter sp.]|nr:MAG: TonB-dependent siderophore receptor [Arcobacter sp.]